MAGGDPHSPKGKVATNDRKSRTGKGRGLPKKGGVELHYDDDARGLGDFGVKYSGFQVELAVKEFGGLLGWFTKTRSLMHETPTMMNLLR